MEPLEILKKEGGSEICPLRWESGILQLIDQRRLPHEESWLDITTWKGARDAIRDMVVRGAPAIGITAAFGMALGAKDLDDGLDLEESIERLEDVAQGLLNARPTAVNLAWAVERMFKEARHSLDVNESASNLYDDLEREAKTIWKEDVVANIEMGRYGAQLIQDGFTVLTHCNAGALATGGYGTALGVIRYAAFSGKRITVLCDETRPWLQGIRLTAWELMKEGIECAVICDGAAGHFMRRSKVDCIVVGADRIAKNGDVANKIGTYTLAELARANSIPFYVAAPFSTIDLKTENGQDIPIEERPEEEITKLNGKALGPSGVRARNPVFDVTPHELVSAIITERGILRPPYKDAILERSD